MSPQEPPPPPVRVSMNLAMSLDGRVERPGGGWYGLSSPGDRRRMDEIRKAHNSLIVGKRTVDIDRPVLSVRDQSDRVLDDSPLPVIVCRGSLPDFHTRTFNRMAGGVLLLAPEELMRRDMPDENRRDHPDARFASSLEHTPLVVQRNLITDNEQARNDLKESLRSRVVLLGGSAMADARGMQTDSNEATYFVDILEELDRLPALLEGGPTLFRLFLEADLVDRIYMTLVPVIIGDRSSAGMLSSGPALPEFDHRKWKLVSVEGGEEAAGDREPSDLFLVYDRIRPPGPPVAPGS